MITIPETTKEMYKDYDRQLSVYGVLYLAQKRVSNNLIDERNYSNIYNCTYSDSIFRQTTEDSLINNEVIIEAYNNDNFVGVLSTRSLQIGTVTFSFIKNSDFNEILFKVNSLRIIGVKFNISGLENGKTYYLGATIINKTQGNIMWKNMYISRYNKYEEYGTMVNDYIEFPLTEENECKILSFNINEKTDVYYTSLPYNTMIIEVDNEKGYFTDYDPDSIVNKLNTECYVDLFIKINEDDYYKIMTMKFDKISSSDYEKARLSFKSSISILNNLPLRDKNNIFSANLINKITLKNYFLDNYNLKLITDVNDNVLMFKTGFAENMSVQNILLQAGTRYGDLSNAVLTLNDSQDRIVQRTWKAEKQDLITRDLQLEKAIIKREDNYRGLKRKYVKNGNWQNTTDTYSYSFSGKLTTSSEIIVLFNKNYKINDVTINDITVVGNVSVNVETSGSAEILELSINGNIGTNYTITINKSNIIKNIGNNYAEEVIGNIDDTSKILNITENAPLLSNYYNLILLERQIKSNIEIRAMGLPYLEVGDTIEVETELAKILMTISELNMNFDGGLTMTIKGYELGWDALFPADDLYPSEILYPNTPLY